MLVLECVFSMIETQLHNIFLFFSRRNLIFSNSYLIVSNLTLKIKLYYFIFYWSLNSVLEGVQVAMFVWSFNFISEGTQVTYRKSESLGSRSISLANTKYDLHDIVWVLFRLSVHNFFLLSEKHKNGVFWELRKARLSFTLIGKDCYEGCHKKLMNWWIIMILWVDHSIQFGMICVKITLK